MRNCFRLCCVVGLLHGLAGAAAEAPSGTLGFRATALFDDGQSSNRGDLVVVDVWEGTPAAAAGVQRGDLVVAIDGVAVAGKNAGRVFKDQLHGAVGGKVRLTLLRPAEALRKLNVDLTRVAFPQRENPSFETFGYSVPGSWTVETYSFPLPFAPKVPLSGIEDVILVPGFDDRSSPSYHGVVWVWWLDEHPAVAAAMLRSTLVEYFRGLSQERGANAKFTPQLEKVTATVSPMAPATPAAAGPAVSAFRGEVVTYNQWGDLITLQVDAEAAQCDAEHTAILFRLAPRPREAAIWKDLRAVTSSFRCRRG